MVILLMKNHGVSLVTPRFYLIAMAQLRDKIWEWPGNKATVVVVHGLFVYCIGFHEQLERWS